VRIYVGNLPYSTSTEQLRALFDEYGEVSDAVHVIDRATQRPKGFGFVEMKKEEEALFAIEKLNSFEYQAGDAVRRLVVTEARPREPKPSRDNYQERGDRDSRRRR
jgi:RNA recognition motif-containing protein